MPTTSYAVNDGFHLAYQVVGDGPFDLLFVPTWSSNLEVLWESPPVARYLRRLAGFSRLVMFDPRGTGLSDSCRPEDLALDARVGDAVAVLDAVGSDRAALFGAFFGGPVVVQLAANHPERCTALVLHNTAARRLAAPDHPIGIDPKVQQRILETIPETWGRANLLMGDALSPTEADWWQRFQRMSLGPGTAATVWPRWTDDDVRHLLPAIDVPSLVVHRRDNIVTPMAHAHHLVDHIRGARLLEIEGSDPGWFFDAQESVLDEVQDFLMGSRVDVHTDRVLATILFTDIVGSTAIAAKMGDVRWRDQLDHHDAMLQRLVQRYGGEVVKGTGDGALVVFDRPSTALQCATELASESARLGFQLRMGLHTGEIERRGEDMAGMAVVIAARVMQLAPPNEVVVTGTVRDLVIGSSDQFADLGAHELKGVPGLWPVWQVVAPSRASDEGG